MMDTAYIHSVRSHMDYKNTEIKLEGIVQYLNEERLNLNPVFQRPSVWNLNQRRELIKNIVSRRPIPAIFVYKDVEGDSSAYRYTILDGKQRVESILLFVGYDRPDFKVATWDKYILVGDLRDEFNFAAPLADKKKKIALKDLDTSVVRELRDYMIPMVEITLNEKTSIDELISLFVDINQQGVKVTRLQIVRALKRNDRFLKDVYALIAERRPRQQAIVAKRRNTDFGFVLHKLQNIASVENMDQKTDRMWERLFELALYVRSQKHRKPSEILKSFISSPDVPISKISTDEMGTLRRSFSFLANAYRKEGVANTRFATDQTHFYTLATTLLGTKILEEYAHKDLAVAIVDFDALLTDPNQWKIAGMPKLVKQYQELSARQTSDSTKRADRQRIFELAIEKLIQAKGGKKSA